MIDFKLEGKEYQLEEFLSIGDYQKIFKIKDLFEDEYLNAKIINLLTDCPIDTLLKSENHKVEFLATTIFAMVPKQPVILIDQFELDGVKYGFLPSYKKITFGEFVDLDTMLTKKPEEAIDFLHIITSIMYRPITKQKGKHDYEIEKYDSNTVEERAELFKKKLDIKFTLGGQFFFTQFVNKSTTYTPVSLIQRIKREWKMIKLLWKFRRTIWKTILKKDLDGMSSSIDLQKTILKDTIRYYKNQL